MANDFYRGTSVAWRDNAKKYQGIVFWYDEDGKRHQKTKLFTNKKRESQAMFEEWKHELNRKARVSKPQETVKDTIRKTVGERLREYLTYLQDEVDKGHYQQSTLTAKWNSANLYIFPDPIAQMAYTRLSRTDIEDWEKRMLKERGISTGTLGIPYSLLRRVYNFDIERGNIEDTPFRFIKSPKANKREKAFATDESLKRLHDALKVRWDRERGDVYAMAYYLAFFTGMRGQEVCGLRWRDVNFTTKQIYVRNVIARNGYEPYEKEPKTKNSKREIPIMPELYSRLEEWRDKVCWVNGKLKEPEPNWYIVGDRDKFLKPQWLTQDFGRFCRRNNVKANDGTFLTMHGLRHTFATLSVQSKAVDVKTLAAILGDTVSMVLETYTGVGDDDLKYRSMEAIGNEIMGRIEGDD